MSSLTGGPISTKRCINITTHIAIIIIYMFFKEKFPINPSSLYLYIHYVYIMIPLQMQCYSLSLYLFHVSRGLM